MGDGSNKRCAAFNNCIHCHIWAYRYARHTQNVTSLIQWYLALPAHDAARRLRPSCGVADNAPFKTPAQQRPESHSSDGAPSGPFAAAVAPIRAQFLHRQAPPSPVPAPMAGDDQHTDQDADDEGAANKGAPPQALDAGAHALEDAGGRDSDMGAGAVSPPSGLLADADDAHVRVELMAAAKAAEDVFSVLLRSVGGSCLGTDASVCVTGDCAAMPRGQ